MYAIIETGGKQYKAEPGLTLDIEKLPVDVDATVTFDKVLLLSDGNENITIGQPYVAGASVSASVLLQEKGPKVVIMKYKRKTGYRRKTGHRQLFTRVKIDAIQEA